MIINKFLYQWMELKMIKRKILFNISHSIFICLILVAFMVISVSAINTKQSFSDLQNMNNVTIITKTQISDTGSSSPVFVKNEIKSGNFVDYSGKAITVREIVKNRIEIKTNSVSAETNLSVNVETDSAGKTKLKIMLKNGQERELMMMPDVASEIALEVLRVKVCSINNNCTLELKSVGRESDEKLQYEMKLERDSKVLGVFQKKMKVIVDVDTQSRKSKVLRPWWSFMTVVRDEN